MIWFTSDSHFNHGKVITYSRRPFANVDVMNKALITRWNDVVAEDDEVFHLGDVGFGNRHQIEAFLAGCKGKKYLVAGNHDYKNDLIRLRVWQSVMPYHELRIGNQFLVLCHYAFRVWNRAHHGSINLHGHSHGNLPGTSQQTDVGVDCWDYTPVNLAQILARLRTLPRYRTQDHHEQNTRQENDLHEEEQDGKEGQDASSGL